MVSSKLKKRFEKATSVLVKPLIFIGITPNVVTIIGLLASIISSLLYFNWNGSQLYLSLAGVFVLISGLLDAIDGVIARMSGKVTVFGGFLDSVIDRYSDSLIFSGITLSGLCPPMFSLMALIGSLLVSYARSRAEAAGVMMAGIGIAERAERMIILASVTFLSNIWYDALSYGILLIAILSHITVIQRVLYFKSKVNKN